MVKKANNFDLDRRDKYFDSGYVEEEGEESAPGFFENLLSCLRRTRHERKSTKNKSKIEKNPSRIDSKLT